MRFRTGTLLRGLNGLIRHRGLIGVHLSARASVQGAFEFGKGVSIGRNSIIQVPAKSQLTLGDRVYIGRNVEISPDSEITIGNFTSLQDRCNILGQVDIGAHCVFAPNVFISSGIHQFREKPAWLIRDQDALVRGEGYQAAIPRTAPVQVHDDCWIGINAVLMRGVTVGRGSVVGANSVVTRSVAPYSIVAGSPARLIGRRLEFRPPRAISSANPDDLPYFYSGFDLRQIAISSSASEGICARGRFRVALDCHAARSVRLEIESNQPVILTHANQRQAVATGQQQVTFSLESEPRDSLIAITAADTAGRPCALALRRATMLD
jgi:acetyltransferase-like isoleucine patch superfamily enzyme